MELSKEKKQKLIDAFLNQKSRLEAQARHVSRRMSAEKNERPRISLPMIIGDIIDSVVWCRDSRRFIEMQVIMADPSKSVGIWNEEAGLVDAKDIEIVSIDLSEAY